MGDEWDENSVPDFSNAHSGNGHGDFVDPGRSFGSNGRGFMAFPDDGGEDYKGFGDGGGYRGRGGRGRGRGGRGGGRGGFRSNDYDKENENTEDSYESGGGYRGGRGGGRGGRGDGGMMGGNTGESGDNQEKKELYIPPEPSNDENEVFGSGISTGMNFSKYDNIAVNVSGENVPPAINSFEKCGLRDIVIDNIKKCNYSTPTPIQKRALPIIMKGRDLMGCAQTGSGKTAAFLLPIINTLLEEKKEAVVVAGTAQPQAVIMLPTRELAIQIWTEARKFAYGSLIKTCIAYGGTASNDQANRIRSGCHILVATTGRLLDFVERHFVSFESIMYVVLDEADRMLDMGFKEHIDKVMTHPTMTEKGNRQTLMFSATFPENIQHMAAIYLSDYIFVTIGIIGGACADVEQVFYDVEKFAKKNKLKEILENSPVQQTLVFVETKRNADYIGIYIGEGLALKVTTIHGDRLQREREIALRDFKSGNCSILVATAVAARGLDIKNVAHVINYDLPKSIDEYVHRIGRTGRLGNRGKATSFFDSSQDSSLTADLCKILTQAEQPVPDFLKSGGSSYYNAGEFGGEDIRGDSTAQKSYNDEDEGW